VTFPTESDIHSARITTDGVQLFLHLFARFKVNLIDFEYKGILQTFSAYVNTLVRKRDK
jgi:hypothetical protein